jgi:hypothetical protein
MSDKKIVIKDMAEKFQLMFYMHFRETFEGEITLKNITCADCADYEICRPFWCNGPMAIFKCIEAKASRGNQENGDFLCMTNIDLK